MSKHVWETKPNQKKADTICECIAHARSKGASEVEADTFAGYYLESCMQSGQQSIEHLYEIASKSWKILSGKNAENYRRCVEIHDKFIALNLAPFVWDKLRNGDVDFVRGLSCRSMYLPAIHAESYQEFLDIVRAAV